MMESELERFSVSRLTKEGRGSIEEVVAREFPVTLILNEQELVTLLCSPTDLKYLAVGFLFSEGLLKSKKDIEKITVDDQRGVIRVITKGDHGLNEPLFKRIITSGCGRGASFYSAADIQGQLKIESELVIKPLEVFGLVRDFQHRSQIYRTTGGVHSAALCDNKSILLFNEDIGRHNAIDKIFGECIVREIITNDRIIITSGRISSEILLKVAKRNIPILISKSAPTNLAVKLANELGITLIGFVRGERMNVYTHGGRILNDGK
ncbi:formate dehydrogenase accessory sulfurtransferase FdhD [Chloroflexota bacterium]